MSASAPPSSAPTTNATASDSSSASTTQQEPSKPNVALEEDDEFEDFPVEDWPQEDAEVPTETQRLWEESWDDDDTSEDFAKQLK
ncbi:MAG: 26S proteasome complex subunit [Icmadophila ericetorum]|nr:26S proteasome complex subunit [Icmadophila ericetorum]